MSNFTPSPTSKYPPIDADRFTYHEPTRTYVIEASDLPAFAWSQITPGRPEVGFQMRLRTGQIAWFYYAEVRREPQPDNDIIAWVCRPTVGALCDNPGLTDVEAHILND